MAHLPLDERGYPVPFFVAWVDGKPDFRCMTSGAWEACVTDRRCWICGGILGRFKAFVLGPIGCLTLTSPEPPSHRQCALFAVQACPFLVRPHAQRREARMPAEAEEPAGLMLKGNPGLVVLWTTTDYRPFRVGAGIGREGLLLKVGDPVPSEGLCEELMVEPWMQGRPASREEFRAALHEDVEELCATVAPFPDAREEVAQILGRLHDFETLMGWPPRPGGRMFWRLKP